MKPETHAAITDLALRAHVDGNESGLLGRDSFRAAIRLGSIREDACWEPSRAANWHFYPANAKLLRPVWGFLRAHSRTILLRREDALLAGLANGPAAGLGMLFGRVLHHIQDMSTPSHVVPVYHGPGLVDAYEDFLVEHWPVVAAALESVPVPAKDDADPEHPFAALYEAAAQRTLAELAVLNFSIGLDGGPERPAGTDLFWRGHDPSGTVRGKYHDHGFGSFGVLGPHYGYPAVTVAGHAYRIAPAVYVTLAARFVGHAVADTLRACRRLEQLLGSD